MGVFRPKIWSLGTEQVQGGRRGSDWEWVDIELQYGTDVQSPKQVLEDGPTPVEGG